MTPQHLVECLVGDVAGHATTASLGRARLAPLVDRHLAQQDQAIAIRKRERAESHRIDDGEGRRARANREGEREDRRDREARGAQ